MSFSSLKGEVICQAPLSPLNLLVELADPTRHITIDRMPLSPTGGFEFRNIPEGTLELRVVNFQGDVLKREWILPEHSAFPVTIRVGSPVQRPVTGIVTPYRLQHKVPKKAMAEFIKADQALKQSKNEKALQHLRKAIAIDAGFVEAYNNLGVRLASEGKLEEAGEMFLTASKLDPHSPTAKQNLRIISDLLLRRSAPRVNGTPVNSFTK